jgi:hypothetical protein
MQLSNASLTFQQHENASIALGMDCNLASILSEEEELAAQRFGVLAFSSLWIGGKFIGNGSSASKTGPENWEWVDGEEWSFEYWAPSAPSGDGECVRQLSPPYAAAGTWTDADCEGSYPAIYKCCK